MLKVFVFFLLCSFSAKANNGNSYQNYTLPALPSWTDRFHQVDPEKVYLDIDKIMKAKSVSRAEAVEMQSQLRRFIADCEAKNSNKHRCPLPKKKAALSKLLNSDIRFRRPYFQESLVSARFIIVMDLDGTLYDQKKRDIEKIKKSARCQKLLYRSKDKTLVKAPGAEAFIKKVNKLGGKVILFSAFPDEPTIRNLKAWPIDGESLYDSPLIAGVFANSHLTLSPGPIIESTPTKDLRMFDEKLDNFHPTQSKVLLIDDNPRRVYQKSNHRYIKDFEPSIYCLTDNAQLIRSFDERFSRILKEIEDSLKYMAKHQTTFMEAYLPYTESGLRSQRFLGKTKDKINYLREHPEAVDIKL